PENALAAGHTDERGEVELPTGPAYGLLVLEAHGGWTRHPWADPVDPVTSDGGVPCPSCVAPSEDDAGLDIPVTIDLRSVLVDFVPGPEQDVVVISPLTTLATAIGERRMIHPFAEANYRAAMLRAFTMLGSHIGGIE